MEIVVCSNPSCDKEFEDGDGVIINDPDKQFCSNECCNDFVDSEKP